MADGGAEKQDHLSTVRETVESIWIAIVLAFVLRAFVLEAFVIPTGSMAPRLMGQHWQFDCPACGYHYAFGIPSRPGAGPPDISRELTGYPPAVCPICGYRYDFDKARAFSGDRVLVVKYYYRFRPPKPWDVVVFKNPQDNDQNYIKRLIGLPGQLVEIVHGDIFVSTGKDRNGDGVIDLTDFDVNGDKQVDQADYQTDAWKQDMPWEILRKSDRSQEVMWQEVFDCDYQPDEEVFAQHRQTWRLPWRSTAGPPAWNTETQGGRVFEFTGADEPATLGFDRDRQRFFPRYAYNHEDPVHLQYDKDSDIVSDLRLSLVFQPGEKATRVGLHLSSLGHHFRAWLGSDGQCLLEHLPAGADGSVRWDDKKVWGQGQLGPLQAGRRYAVALVHADRQVKFYVDGKVVLQSNDRLYPADHETVWRETAGDIPTPMVAILGQGGAFHLRRVSLQRDVYYTCPPRPDRDGQEHPAHGVRGYPMLLRKFTGDPDRDEFFVLGDNSPASLDSRLWSSHSATLREGYRDGTVPRYSLMGKAFFVYWPGGYRLPFWPRLPIIPNVGRMRLIR